MGSHAFQPGFTTAYEIDNIVDSGYGIPSRGGYNLQSRQSIRDTLREIGSVIPIVVIYIRVCPTLVHRFPAHGRRGNSQRYNPIRP